MSLIYWDTMLFVYWLEDNPEYNARIAEIRTKMAERGDKLCTSAFAVGELLAGQYKRGLLNRVPQLRETFEVGGVEILPFTLETAGRFGEIRASHPVSPGDAIHLACAAEAGVNPFLTTDRQLQRLVIPGIHFIAGLDVNVF